MEKAAITGYSIVKPSRARKDKNEDVFTNEQYQGRIRFLPKNFLFDWIY